MSETCLRLIEDRPYRDALVTKLRRNNAPDIVRRWEMHNRVKEGERAEVEQWFISKFGDFRRSEGLAKATFGKPSVNLTKAVDKNAAVLVKVPATALGAAASRFLGSFIVERILRYAMTGAFIGKESPAYLIVDEFQNFVGTSFVTLIPEARKFNLGITVANQTLSQLSSFSPHEGRRNDGLSQIILGNVGNLIIQGVGRSDAERLATEVGMTTTELSQIGKHTALVQLTVNGERLDPFTVNLSASHERPGTVAEEVALTQAAEALERLGADVVIPVIDRPVAPEPAGTCFGSASGAAVSVGLSVQKFSRRMARGAQRGDQAAESDNGPEPLKTEQPEQPDEMDTEGEESRFNDEDGVVMNWIAPAISGLSALLSLIAVILVSRLDSH